MVETYRFIFISHFFALFINLSNLEVALKYKSHEMETKKKQRKLLETALSSSVQQKRSYSYSEASKNTKIQA